MALTIDTFLQQSQVASTQGEHNLFLHENGQLAKTSSFSFFRGHARARENDATAQEFLNALNRDPVYKKYISCAQQTLDSCRQQGKPLTTRHIAMVRQALDREVKADMDEAITFGKQLAEQGVIPKGAGTSFGLFYMRHAQGQRLGDSTAVSGQILRDFFQNEVLSAHVAKLCQERGMGDNATTVLAILEKSGLLTQGLEHAFGAQELYRPHEAQLDHALSLINESISAVLDRLQDIHAQGTSLNGLQDLPNLGAVLHTLSELVHSGALEKSAVSAFVSAIKQEGMAISTPVEHSHVLRSFHLNHYAQSVGEKVLSAFELPENLASPLAHHPKVQSAAREILDAMVLPPALPTKAQASQALEQALTAFITIQKPLLQEFVAMAQDPPVELKPKALSPDTLPRFINVLLEGDFMLDALTGGEMGEDFLQQVEQYSHAVNSCTHGVRGSFGTDDAIGVEAGAMQLLLARRGVAPADYPGLLQTTLNRLGPLASEVTSVALACQTNELRGPGALGLLSTSLGVYRALETQLGVLLHLVPEDELTTMQIAGANHKARMGNLVDQQFQRDIPLTHVSDTTRAFVRAHGVEIADMPADVRTAQHQAQELQERAAQQVVQNAVLKEFFPDGMTNIEDNPIMFYTAFDEAASTMDLTGLDPDKISAENFFLAARNACIAWRQDNPGVPTPEMVRTVVMESIAASLQELKATLDQIDTLPLRQGRAEVPGTFTPEEKTVIKDMVMATGLRDVALIVRLANTARTQSGALASMCREQNTAHNLTEGVVSLANAFKPHREELQANPVLHGEDALGGMVMMAIGFAGLAPERLEYLFTSLNGELGQEVSGAFNHYHDEKGIFTPTLLTATRIMDELRMNAGAQINERVERDPLFFQERISELGAMDGVVIRHMSHLDSRLHSLLDQQLAHVHPPLDTAQRAVLSALAPRLENLAPQRLKFLIPLVLQGNAQALLAAQAANGERPLSAGQIWQAITGHAAPRGLREADLGQRLLPHLVATYNQAVNLACPDSNDTTRLTSVNIFGLGLSFPTMLALTRPGARLTLNEVGLNLGMSSLRNYGPENAYGLVTDFRRRDPGTLMRLESVDEHGNERGMEVRPFHISDAENVASHPLFQQMIRQAEQISASPAQKARVLQAFSQAALAMPRALSTAFPGIGLSEHGNFSVTASRQEDNTVVVNIISDPSLPLNFRQQFIIEPNGDHRCSEFIMERR